MKRGVTFPGWRSAPASWGYWGSHWVVSDYLCSCKYIQSIVHLLDNKHCHLPWWVLISWSRSASSAPCFSAETGGRPKDPAPHPQTPAGKAVNILSACICNTKLSGCTRNLFSFLTYLESTLIAEKASLYSSKGLVSRNRKSALYLV